jgi:hypothetical protein
MSAPTSTRWKYSRELLRQLERSGNNKPIEVIVRVKDPEALTRAMAEATAGYLPDEVAEQEQRHTQDLLGKVIEFVQRLEGQGAPVRLLDSSWLTHSVLASATPAIVRKLAEREEVDLLELNAETQLLPTH